MGLEGDWLVAGLPRVGLVGHNLQHQWHDARRLLYDHELLCFGPGSDCQIGFGTERVACGPGSWIIISPGVWHTCSGTVPAGSFRLWVHFDWEYRPVAADAPRMCYHPARPQRQHLRLAPERVPQGFQSGACCDIRAVQALHGRLAGLWRGGDPRAGLVLMELLLALRSQVPAISRQEDILEAARQALIALAQRPFSHGESIRAILAGLGQSYDHLARRFRTAYGVTPLHFVNAQRMQQAARLLQESDWSIDRIATQLGFDDPGYFRRLFRRITGRTPSALRAAVSTHPPAG